VSELDQQLYAALADGAQNGAQNGARNQAQVLTASARAARALTRDYALRMRDEGKLGWRAPNIASWAEWTAQLYDAFAMEHTLPVVLTPLQEEYLWREVIEADSTAAVVVAPGRLAQLAQSGYALLGNYTAHALRRDPTYADAHQDSSHFLDWANSFERRCAALRFTSASLVESQLAALLTNQAAPASFRLPATLWLAGFDRFTPSQELLLQALQSAGIHIHRVKPRMQTAQRRIVHAADPRHERESCALWIRKQLQAQPDLRIGVLVPDLGKHRAEIDRTFRRLLTPASAQSPAGAMPPFEFSLGSSLAKMPVIAAALLLLAWVARPASELSATAATTLLTSRFLAGSAAEAQALAEADAALRQAGLLTAGISIATLLRRTSTASRVKALPAPVHARLQAAAALGRQMQTGTRLPSAWALVVASMLAAFGWPGYQPLDSFAFQAQQRFLTLVDQMALLDLTGQRRPWSDFVDSLTAAAQQTLFAAETRDAPVQVLGAAEAAGLEFDALWFLHVQEDSWPAPGRLHPLLPPALQQHAGMPHARHTLDQQLAQAQMRRIASSVGSSGPGAVCSYSLQQDGVEARPSRLLPLFTDQAPQALPGANLTPAISALRQETEPIQVRAWPLDRPAGGSEILKRQAACGFQSFAVRRLNARGLESEAWGLDDRERATLLHRALECLWQPVGSNDPQSLHLHTKDDLDSARANGRLTAMIDRAIDQALANELAQATGDRWLLAYLHAEKQRLQDRITAWLLVESARPEFGVCAVEQELPNVPIGALHLNLRADRIDLVQADTLQGQGLLVLDYKTGSSISVRSWDQDRPKEPQLPIYAIFGLANGRSCGLTQDAATSPLVPVVGVAFAQIRAGRDRLLGSALNPQMQLGQEPDDKNQLDEQKLQAWSSAITGLADAFAHGHASVNPREGKTTCTLCGLQGVCRVSTADLLGNSPNEDNEEETQEDEDASAIWGVADAG
jgi:ATP-dependent helicase/nuclease subunit B